MDYRVVKFIKNLREEHPRIGKEKIKPLLDKHCELNGIKTVSESTVGNILKRHKFFHQPDVSGKIYHNPNSKWAERSGERTTSPKRIGEVSEKKKGYYYHYK